MKFQINKQYFKRFITATFTIKTNEKNKVVTNVNVVTTSKALKIC